MKRKPTPELSSRRENKSTAAEKLGGQPETDREARAAGFISATAESAGEPPAIGGRSKRRRK